MGLDEAAGGETPLEGGVLAGVDTEPERSDAAAEPTGLATVTSADDADTGADRVGSVEAPQTLWRFGIHGDGKRSWRPIAAVAVAGLLAVAFVAPLPAILVWPTWTQDEGTLLVLPSMILKGATPNHTFLSIYGPANLYAIAAAFFIAGQSVLVERIVAVLYHLVLVSSLAALAWRRRGMFAGLTAGAVTIVVGVSYPMMAFAWVGAIAFLALGLYLIDLGLSGRSSPLFVGIAGLALGLAISFRADISLAVLLIVIVVEATRRRVVRYLLAGLVAGLIPTIVNVVQVGIVAVFEDEIVRPVFVIGPQVRLSLPSPGTAPGLLMLLSLLIPVAEIVVGIAGWRRSHGAWDDVCVVLVGVTGLAIVSNMLHRPDLQHIAFVASFTLGAAVLLDWARIVTWLARRSLVRAGMRIAWSAAIGIVAISIATAASDNAFGGAALVTIVAVKHHGAWPNAQFPVSNAGRSVPVWDHNAMVDYDAVLQAVDSYSVPGTSVFIGSQDLRVTGYSDTFLYFLLPRLVPGSFYLEMDPGVTNAAGSGLASQIARDDLLILNSVYDSNSSEGTGEPYASYGSNTPNLVVERDFRLVGSWGTLSLYVRRGFRAHQ